MPQFVSQNGHILCNTCLNHSILSHRAQLQEQNSLLIVEKSELRRVLRDFESGFTAMNGR